VCGFSESGQFRYTSDGALKAVDQNWSDSTLVTSGVHVDLWTPLRSSPIQRFELEQTEYTDSVFNQGEPNPIIASPNSRKVIVADTRTRSVARSITLAMRTNAVDWNPQISFYVITANDDSALYLFDIRKTEAAVRVFTEHLEAVTSVAFSPNGREFVYGGYHGTIVM
jgi:WD repeat and SOF domain-containing protein 1